MISKTKLNKKAVVLRRKGLTYSEILSQVPVAKSTLALWFKEVHLSAPQIQRITEKRIAAALNGARAKRDKRIIRSNSIKEIAENEIGDISDRELWLTGITLYWAEGSKEKEWKPGSNVSFINMDRSMIQVYLKWLKFCKINNRELKFEIYIHDNHRNRVDEIKLYWSKITKFPVNKFTRIYFKKNKVDTKRKNIGDIYFGILKINIRQSSTFLRKIAGWTNGIYNGINKE